MKLAIDPETITPIEVDKLASDDLVKEITNTLNIPDKDQTALKFTIKTTYHDFLDGYYEVQNALPEHKESKLLKKVVEDASNLLDSLNDLIDAGKSNQRLADKIETLYCSDEANEHELATWGLLTNNEPNPNFNVREFIADLLFAADCAADTPDTIKPSSSLKEELSILQDGNAKEEIEREVALAELIEEIHPNRHEERKERTQIRKTSKDLPIRNSIHTIKKFFDAHIETPFTAGKYYPETGFKSPAFYAVKIILKKIYPTISDRKIASIMQELAADNGYNFSSQDNDKNCSTD
ncbi:MAG: hypothetical protein ACRBCK_12600 [Alphaproteobacteria bacterium]